MFRRTIAASSLILATLAVSGCDGTATGDDETYVEESPAAEPPCADPLADPAVLERNRNADRALKAAIAQGRADPIEEAQKAAAAGDFRLVAAVTVEGIDTRGFGALCALRGGLNPRMARVVTYYGEDGEPSPEPTDTASAAPEATREDNLVAFARAFNQALIADPAYPYRDVCRPLEAQEADAAGKDVGSAHGAVLRAISEAPKRAYGYPDLGPLQTGATLADAARRGNVAALRRILNEEAREQRKLAAEQANAPVKPGEKSTNRPAPKSAIDSPDLFGMTPLAWAMAYRRDEAVRLLLSHGASPSGAQCQALVDRDSPMQIARALGWIGMVQRMKPKVSEEDYAALAEEAQLADGSKAEFNGELAKLGDRYGKIFNKDEMTRHTLHFKIDARGGMTSCAFEPKTVSPEFDADICKLGRDVLEWVPARDSEGRPVAGEGKVMIRLRGT
ncbi:hypothetical protein EDF56_103267 [Novosphingobium sp. PhB165]|uniref:ankyrin repeat domain-containing protein n=1 Tax=Novosphingobium sp. PhB165 TaxID=2485105 RepID=UPI00104F49B4|nr:ankyrin repeat domain-containing protein [Novosphingobium sp. PhB165]TCM19624.1 hypothetical protein EDF56_103267 [Novosphingobium sp. PhB165]